MIKRLRSRNTQHVTITLLGSAQDIFYDNFITHVAKTSSFGAIITFCLDRQAKEFCAQMDKIARAGSIDQTCIEPMIGSKLYKGNAWKDTAQGAVTYGDRTYFQIITLKPALFSHVLGYGI